MKIGMFDWRKKLSLLVFVSVILFLSSIGLYGGTVGGLFDDITLSAGSPQVMTKPDPTVIRHREVTVNFDLVAGADFPQGAQSLVLNLFSEVSFRAVKVRWERRSATSYTWVGRIPEIEHSQVILVVENGEMAGNITMPGGIYHVRTLGSGVYTIRAINQGAFPPEAPPIPVKPPQEENLLAPQTQTDDGSTIDVMVVYTAAAASTPGIAAEIQLAIDETNTAYANSNITQRLSLVHSAQVTYTESGDIGTDLSRLQNPSDGFMDEVPTLRNTYKSDAVSMWVSNGGGYCGIGYLMSTVSSSFAPNAYNVVARSCATGYYSFGHELGHNMGALHDWYVDSGTSPYEYAHGYVYRTGLWRTIMAYNTECTDSGIDCTRLQYFSNPSVTYGGVAMGSAVTADNHRSLDNTASTVANFRSSSTCSLQSITKDQSKLNLYRKFRDKVLSQTETGQEYTRLYYNHSPEVTLLLLKDSILRNQAKKLLDRIIPEIRLILDGKRNDLSPGLKNEILIFLKKVSPKTSPGLKTDIERLIADIKEGRTKEILETIDSSSISSLPKNLALFSMLWPLGLPLAFVAVRRMKRK